MVHTNIDPTAQARRRFLQNSALASTACLLGLGRASNLAAAPVSVDESAKPTKAQIAITLDLEMSRNFPTWETTHWDYEKGNLDEAAKQYSLKAARRVREAGGVIHFFVVARVLEQANVDWLLELAAAGHPLGNHTYDHVNVTASRVEDVQFRFQRSPWLAGGLTPTELIQQNIRLAELAMRQRLNLERPAGFRTPGGFAEGLRPHPQMRRFLLDQGYGWISSLYPPHANTQPGERPSKAIIDNIVERQSAAQPFRYDDGLIELPMNPVSDIGAFRTGRWHVDWFVDVVDACLDWVIAERAAFDFLAHPSCLGVMDPEMKVIGRILQRVAQAGNAAELVSLDQLALRVPANRVSK